MFDAEGDATYMTCQVVVQAGTGIVVPWNWVVPVLLVALCGTIIVIVRRRGKIQAGNVKGKRE
ncbi:MAG: hypothetical protein ACTSUE_19520 [Promethearchaeota archaeon]